jgi:hypothetical protein
MTELAKELMYQMWNDKIPSTKSCIAILEKAGEQNCSLPNILQFNNLKVIKIIGDTYGQFQF